MKTFMRISGCLWFSAVAACLPLLALAGCRESWQADTYPASGRVAINGEPPGGALVQLVPAGGTTDERNSRPWGLVKEDGTFVLSTYNGEPGAPAGDYVVTMTWPPDASRPSMADRLKSRYARPERSPWRVTITQGENVLPLIEATGVEVDSVEKAEKPAGTAAAVHAAGPMLPPLAKTKARKGRR